jgi:putative ubiquitin-RnfH superfamily antitoxin RatB of RatAB toxin-antitoxin module
MDSIPANIQLEIAYALPGKQVLMSIQAQPDISAEQAIRQSGILTKCPEIDLAKNKIGIFGKLSKLDTLLRDGDRVEIYRPLIADPKEVRKKRAEEGKVMKKGGGDVAAAETENAA